MNQGALERLELYRERLTLCQSKGWKTRKLERIVADLEKQLAGNNSLNKALELADLRAVVAEHYPDAGVLLESGVQTIRAVWRGGDSLNVRLEPGRMFDYKLHESYNVWTFLTDIVGLSRREAAKEVLYRTGLSEEAPVHHVAKRFRRDFVKERAEAKRRKRYQAKRLRHARFVQEHGLRKGDSGYLERKGVASILVTHRVLGDLVYAVDEYDAYIQLPYRSVEGETQGYQRIYDSACLPTKKEGECRDKDFIGPTMGAAITLLPKELSTLPEDTKALAKLYRQGYRLALAEGFATGASLALAKAKLIVLCALNAGNLDAAAQALRETYGYHFPRRLFYRPSFSFDLYADNDCWGEQNVGLEKAALVAQTYGGRLFAPKFKRKHAGLEPTDFNDLHQLEGLQAIRKAKSRRFNSKSGDRLIRSQATDI